MKPESYKLWALFLLGVVVGYAGIGTLAMMIAGFGLGFVLAANTLEDKRPRKDK